MDYLQITMMIPTHFPYVPTRSTGKILGKTKAFTRSCRFSTSPNTILKADRRPRMVTIGAQWPRWPPRSKTQDMVLDCFGLDGRVALDVKQHTVRLSDCAFPPALIGLWSVECLTFETELLLGYLVTQNSQSIFFLWCWRCQKYKTRVNVNGTWCFI